MATLVVQMGHCFRRTGATGTTGEQAFTSAVGEACVRLLDGRSGWTVRKILADADPVLYRGAAFVAVHCDGSTSTTARGASVGYRTPEGQGLGQAWKRAYAARGWPGFRQDNYTSALAQYYGTGTAVAQGNRRAIIVESGFLTNPEDRGLLHAAGGPERVALAIGDALGIASEEEDDMATPQEIADAVWKYQTTNVDERNAKEAGAWAQDRLAFLDKNAWAIRGELGGLRAVIAKLADVIAQDRDDLTAEELKQAAKDGTREALAEGVVKVDIDVQGQQADA